MCSGFRALLVCAFAAVVLPPVRSAEAGSSLDATYQLGAWIWSSSSSPRQTCRFWRRIDIPAHAAVIDARLRITGDNEFHLFVDGQDLGRRAEWRSITVFNLTSLLTPGTHIIAVEGFNDYADAGVIVGLRVRFGDGRTLEVGSDESWKLVPMNDRGWRTRTSPRPDWKPAHIVQPAYEGGNWNVVVPRVIHEPRVEPLVVRFWERSWFQASVLGVCALAVIGCVTLLVKLAAQARGQAILQKERARIARDIHDDFGARLTKLVLVGELARNEAAAGVPVQARFDQICAEGRSLLGAVDEVIWTVNSRRDTLRDFESYVCRYTETFLRAAGIRCRIDGDASVPDTPFDLSIRRNLFLALKEALNNAVRHAGATEVELSIHLREEKVSVTIADNGRGFDSTQARADRNGLTNMQHRIVEIGGECRLTSSPGGGCRVDFVAPLQRSSPPFFTWLRRAPRRSAGVTV